MSTLEKASGSQSPNQHRLDADSIEIYLARGRQLHAEAVAGYVAALARGLVRLPRRLVSLIEGLPRNRLWRVPGSGNCFNC